MAGLLEVRLAGQERKANQIRALIGQVSTSMGSADSRLLMFHAAGLKRLADAEAMLAACESEAAELRNSLLAARGRETAFSTQAKLHRRAEERKVLDQEGLEAALRMATKVSGKADVVR